MNKYFILIAMCILTIFSANAWEYQAPAHISDMAVDGNGNVVATSSGNDLTILDTDGSILWEKTLLAPIKSVAVSQDGSKIAAITEKPTGSIELEPVLYMYDSAGAQLWNFSAVSSFDWVFLSDDGDKVSVLSSGGELYVLDNYEHTYDTGYHNQITGTLEQLKNQISIDSTNIPGYTLGVQPWDAQMNNDGNTIVIGSPDGTLIVADCTMRIQDAAAQDIIRHTYDLAGWIEDVDINHGKFAAGTRSGLVRVYDTVGPAILGSYNVNTNSDRGVSSLDITSSNTIAIQDITGIMHYLDISSTPTLIGSGLADGIILDGNPQYAAVANDEIVLTDKDAKSLPDIFWYNISQKSMAPISYYSIDISDYVSDIKVTSDDLFASYGNSLVKKSMTPPGNLHLSADSVTLAQSAGMQYMSLNVNSDSACTASIKNFEWVGVDPDISIKVLRPYISQNGTIDIMLTPSGSTSQGNYTLNISAGCGPLSESTLADIEVSSKPFIKLEPQVQHIRILKGGTSSSKTIYFNATFFAPSAHLSVGVGNSYWQDNVNSIYKTFRPMGTNLYANTPAEFNLTFNVYNTQPTGNYTYIVNISGTSYAYPEEISASFPVTVEVVDSSVVEEIVIEPFSTPLAEDTPFDFTIKALDSSGEPIEGLNGNFVITAQNYGVTIDPISGYFTDGVATIPLTIYQSESDVVLKVTFNTGTQTLIATTSPFDVISGPDFGMEISPASTSLELGSSTSANLSFNSYFGFESDAQVTGRWSGDTPSGVNISYPSSVSIPSSVPVDISTSYSGSTGTYTYILTANTGSKAHSTQILVTLNTPDYNSRISALESWQSSITPLINDLYQMNYSSSVSWDDITDIPADIADGDDNTHIDEKKIVSYVEKNGFLKEISWGNISNIPYYLLDGDDVLPESKVDEYVSNNGYITNVSWADISGVPSKFYEEDKVLTEQEVDTYVSNNGYLTNVSWSEIMSIPSDIADGDDNTQLSEEEVISYVSNNGFLKEVFWKDITDIPKDLADGDDILTEREVDEYVSNNGYLTGISWSDISDIPKDIADGDNESKLTKEEVRDFVSEDIKNESFHRIGNDTLIANDVEMLQKRIAELEEANEVLLEEIESSRTEINDILQRLSDIEENNLAKLNEEIQNRINADAELKEDIIIRLESLNTSNLDILCEVVPKGVRKGTILQEYCIN